MTHLDVRLRTRAPSRTPTPRSPRHDMESTLMTPPDDRHAPSARTATDLPSRPDAAPAAVLALAPAYRYLILFNTVLSAAGLALAVIALPRGGAAAPVGDPVRPPVSGCLTSASAASRDATPQLPARQPQPADSPRAEHLAAVVLGCRLQLI